MHKKQIMELACKAGKIMLENGGEIYRVEQTMTAVCTAYGISDCESFATPTVIMLSAKVDGEPYCRMMRIAERGINLHKVAEVNDFARKVPIVGTVDGSAFCKNHQTQKPSPCPLEPSPCLKTAAQELERIENTTPHPLWVRILASGIGVAAFAIVFGGGIYWGNIFGGLALGVLARLVVTGLQKKHASDFIVNLVGGATAALGGWLFSQIGLGADPWVVTVAAMMLLVPGLLFTNALRDIAAGDLVSGGSRGIEALSVAVALACGTAAVYAVLALLPMGGGLL